MEEEKRKRIEGKFRELFETLFQESEHLSNENMMEFNEMVVMHNSALLKSLYGNDSLHIVIEMLSRMSNVICNKELIQGEKINEKGQAY